MAPERRIIANTTAQYTRTLINVCLSLYSTRLILQALGQGDFGIYSVVAGVVAMLAFMTNALSNTTQRYLSYYQGKGDQVKMYQVFGNSALLHVLTGLSILFVLSIAAYPVVHQLLSIEPERQCAATIVYFAALAMLLLSFMTAPFRALFIAHEDIIYISVVDVIDGALKVLIAIFLTHVASYDKLIVYSILMIGISVFNILALGVYGLVHYNECHLPHLREWDREHIRDLSGFVGWTIYGTGCIVARNQGIAVMLNILCGTIANAAYGIAQQVNGAVAFISSSIINAMNPQIMQAEGAGNREEMIQLAEKESKFSFLLLSLVSVPLLFEMDAVLRLWLSDVPPYASGFCRMMLLSAVLDQLSVGLTSANQAIGQIRTYTLIFYTFKLTALATTSVCVLCGVDPVAALWCLVLTELAGSLLRIILLKHQADISIRQFARNVLCRIAFPAIAITGACYISIHSITGSLRPLFTLTLGIVCGIIAIWLTALDKSEKQTLTMIIKRR